MAVKTKRRFFQFKLRTLLVLVTLVSVGLGWLGCSQSESPGQPAASKTATQVVPEKETTKEEPAEKPQPQAEPGSLEITFDDLKFDIERGGDFEESMLTDEIRELEGKRVRIAGYLIPLEGFFFPPRCLLLPTMNFDEPETDGRDPILVLLTNTAFSQLNGVTNPIVVEGQFAINRYRDDGTEPPLFIYEIHDAIVIDQPDD